MGRSSRRTGRMTGYAISTRRCTSPVEAMRQPIADSRKPVDGIVGEYPAQPRLVPLSMPRQ